MNAYTAKKDILYTQVLVPNYLQAQIAFRGFAKSVTSYNIEGTFDVLPQHENFVTVIRDRVTIVNENGEKYEFGLQRGLLEASNNEVKIFVEF